jgi:hypothetical protein
MLRGNKATTDSWGTLSDFAPIQVAFGWAGLRLDRSTGGSSMKSKTRTATPFVREEVASPRTILAFGALYVIERLWAYIFKFKWREFVLKNRQTGGFHEEYQSTSLGHGDSSRVPGNSDRIE